MEWLIAFLPRFDDRRVRINYTHSFPGNFLLRLTRLRIGESRHQCWEANVASKLLGWILVIIGLLAFLSGLFGFIQAQFGLGLPVLQLDLGGGDLQAIARILTEIARILESFVKLSIPVQWAIMGLGCIGLGTYLLSKRPF